ncbi:hypothetical protein PtA15_5A812 [Puccinia triticina]|uniref:Senescence domain-containing protein n=1 Tax=Puccinia triticina TaxID=208348 RepID=A0ABY7CJ41_9BASI|nr:uncharacterized protein PtA15_5A812 [Puccinia triticina]WAQ85238.1 hypothetical protein PtA15_5A812 [Puccinia triticina]
MFVNAGRIGEVIEAAGGVSSGAKATLEFATDLAKGVGAASDGVKAPGIGAGAGAGAGDVHLIPGQSDAKLAPLRPQLSNPKETSADASLISGTSQTDSSKEAFNPTLQKTPTTPTDTFRPPDPSLLTPKEPPKELPQELPKDNLNLKTEKTSTALEKPQDTNPVPSTVEPPNTPLNTELGSPPDSPAGVRGTSASESQRASKKLFQAFKQTRPGTEPPLPAREAPTLKSPAALERPNQVGSSELADTSRSSDFKSEAELPLGDKAQPPKLDT